MEVRKMEEKYPKLAITLEIKNIGIRIEEYQEFIIESKRLRKNYKKEVRVM